MRFLHIADLHLGKQMNDVTLLPDQEYILSQIVSIAENERVDAVLIAGDVYQRSSPQAEAMALFDRFVSRLAEQGRQVFIISGNHDSAQRISYFSSLIKSSGVYVTEAFDGRLQNVALRDRDGGLVVWMLPFLRPSQVKRHLPEEKIVTYQDAVEAVLRQTPIDLKKRNILLCHQFITGCETSDSEERAVGGLDNIDAKLFDAFDYVALGHIHKPRIFKNTRMAYCGSPEPLDNTDVGPRGLLSGDVTKTGFDLRWRRIAELQYREIEMMVDTDTLEPELLDRLREEIAKHPDDIYRITLNGARAPEVSFDADAISQLAKVSKVIDNTEPEYNIGNLLLEHSGDLIARFISELQDSEDDPVRRNALYYGLNALLDSN
jgi:exonuclease SbcD